ncbi:MAG: catalase [Bryobacteraceae bacterium]
MLQARLIGYPDAHRCRLGANAETLPVNRPQCPVHTHNRDGFMRADENGGDAPNHEPNSHMKAIPERIAKLQIEHFTKAEPAYGRGVGEARPGLRGSSRARSSRDLEVPLHLCRCQLPPQVVCIRASQAAGCISDRHSSLLVRSHHRTRAANSFTSARVLPTAVKPR